MGNQTELEYKFAADHVATPVFCEMLIGDEPALYEKRDCFDDVYYQRGSSIVRHRHARGGELTVKVRQSPDSIMDRVEVNLCFAPQTDRSDVEAFLAFTGYERMFAVRKFYVHIFEFKRPDYEVEVCLYSVARVDLAGQTSHWRKFIEAEIKRKPGSNYEDWRLKGSLESWRSYLQSLFKLDEPLNQSLLEIYSDPMSPLTATTDYRI